MKASDSVLGYFISKITSQEHRFQYKKVGLPEGQLKIGYFEIEPKVKY